MTAIYRQRRTPGRVIGIAVDNNGARKLNIRARKAVILATGGSTGNVNFRRMFDPRLTEEYCGARRHALVEPGRQRRACRHGDRRVAVGAVQLHRAKSATGLTKPGQIGVPIRLRESALDAGQPSVRQGARHRPAGRGLAERHHGQHAGQALL